MKTAPDSFLAPVDARNRFGFRHHNKPVVRPRFFKQAARGLFPVNNGYFFTYCGALFISQGCCGGEGVHKEAGDRADFNPGCPAKVFTKNTSACLGQADHI
ncbi:hypothetical protein [Ereboglobus luteus]|uniref:hypothetical protein n=1 Tax=Ereboglobus luteus TaxID=1796921 RepID=UPI001F265E37|nr:hypothetical protein [Ereboglobus luteus]